MSTHKTFENHGVSLTSEAANKLKEIKDGTQNWGLRFADKHSLCGSGYEYLIDFASAPQSQDEVFYSQGIAIYVPKESIKRLQGSVIEFHHEHANPDQRLNALEKIGFTVSNPNIKGPCPCACDRGFDI